MPTADDGQVTAFLEKGEGPVPTNRINAGAYVVEREVETMIPPGRAVSFEREVFPLLAGHGLYGYEADGYWVDIGQPQRYLEATWDLLAGRVESKLPPRDRTGSLIYPLCWPGPTSDRRERGGAPLLWGPTPASSAPCSTTACTWAPTPRWWRRSWPSGSVWASARVEPQALVGAGAVIGEDAVIEEESRSTRRRGEPGTRVARPRRVS